MDYQTALELKEAGVSQRTRKHINKYEAVFWTRRQTDYPAYPIASDILVIVKEKLRERYCEWPEQVADVMLIFMKSGTYGLDETYKLAQVLLDKIPNLLKPEMELTNEEVEAAAPCPDRDCLDLDEPGPEDKNHYLEFE